jgi:hypothetical protein
LFASPNPSFHNADSKPEPRQERKERIHLTAR